MSGPLLRIYHAFPGSFRSIPATVRGYYLRWWRYGPETDDLVQESIEREQWSAQQWRNWQEERLFMVLRRAATQVPYYRNYWFDRRAKGDRSSWEKLENWPILDKEKLRQNPRAFVADDCRLYQMYEEHTSGTTGKPLMIWQKRSTVKRWFALMEARVRRWNGVDRRDRWAILGGQLVTPVEQSKPPFWVWNAGLKQLYMSSYHLSPKNARSYFDALQEYRVKYILGYASSLYTLAQEAQNQNITVTPLTVALNNAEPLYAHQRELIASAFRCPVRDTYGMTEIVAAGSECNSGTFHLWPEAGIVEVLNDTNSIPVEPGKIGRFICTGLLNPDMPLIRYEVGDRGAVAGGPSPCACKRELPALQSLEGRCDDVIVTPDGRRIGRLDPVFKADFRIRESQIIQENIQRLCIRVVPADGYSEQDAKRIIESLREHVGNMEISLETLREIPRSNNGKFRAVVSLLPKKEATDSHSLLI